MSKLNALFNELLVVAAVLVAIAFGVRVYFEGWGWVFN